jgi:hypothetical protein
MNFFQRNKIQGHQLHVAVPARAAAILRPSKSAMVSARTTSRCAESLQSLHFVLVQSDVPVFLQSSASPQVLAKITEMDSVESQLPIQLPYKYWILNAIMNPRSIRCTSFG